VKNEIPATATYSNLLRNSRFTLTLALLTILDVVTITQSAAANADSYAITTLLRDAGDLLKAGKLNESKDKYLKALAEDSLNQHALKNIGYIFSLQKDYKNSLAYLQKAEKVGPADADTYNLLAIAQSVAGDTAGSLISYRKAVNLSSDNVSYIKNYGAALVSAGRFTDAIPVLDSARALNPSDGELSFLLGNSYAGLSKPKEAIKSFRAAMELNYDTGDLRYHLGMVSESIGDFWSAEEHYGFGISKAPKNLELRQRLAVLYLRTGVYGQARRLLADNLTHDPNFINSRVALGACYAHLGFPDSAKAELQKVQRIDQGKYEVMKKLVDSATKQYNDSKNKNSTNKADSATKR
jgi:tetratricopeptide (TPR) repeat protein